MRPSALSLAFIAMLGGFDIAHAVCPGSAIAIGTAKDNTDGTTEYNVYDGPSCNNLQILQINTAIGPCDSRYFLCAVGTKNIEVFDDPKSGDSYLCTADTTSETCAGDTVTLCCNQGFRP